MYVHVTESKEAKAFLKECGCYIMKKSSYNAVTIKHRASGKELQLWAESDSSVAAGIPGMFVDEAVSS